jgi:hypothetical protein
MPPINHMHPLCPLPPAIDEANNPHNIQKKISIVKGICFIVGSVLLVAYC